MYKGGPHLISWCDQSSEIFRQIKDEGQAEGHGT